MLSADRWRPRHSTLQSALESAARSRLGLAFRSAQSARPGFRLPKLPSAPRRQRAGCGNRSPPARSGGHRAATGRVHGRLFGAVLAAACRCALPALEAGRWRVPPRTHACCKSAGPGGAERRAHLATSWVAIAQPAPARPAARPAGAADRRSFEPERVCSHPVLERHDGGPTGGFAHSKRAGDIAAIETIVPGDDAQAGVRGCAVPRHGLIGCLLLAVNRRGR